MNIDFIKWMVGFAEGFSIKSEDGEDFSINVPLKNTFLESWCNHFRTDMWSDIYYPLLLQRAFEGWNLNSPQYYIQQSDYICIYDDWGEPTDFENIPISDEAKEKALEYIYNQEVEGE